MWFCLLVLLTINWCNIVVWNWFNTMKMLSALWVLMAWCFSTRASVTIVLTIQLFISSFLWLKPKDFSCHFKIYRLLHVFLWFTRKMLLSSILCLWHNINIWTHKHLFIDNVIMKWKFCHLDKTRRSPRKRRHLKAPRSLTVSSATRSHSGSVSH